VYEVYNLKQSLYECGSIHLLSMLKATHLRDLTNILRYGREAHPQVIIPTLYKLLIELNNFFPKGSVFLFHPIPEGLHLVQSIYEKNH
jgi:hypothetical protein